MVVLGVEVAGNGAAVTAGNPQVGATGVQNDLELLRRSADGDLREVLSVEEVADGNGVATLLGLDGGLLEHLVGVALGADGSCDRAYQLLGQRDLLQRHLVHAGGGGASRDSGGEECGSLHDCSGMWLMGIWYWDGRTRGGGQRGDDRASLPLVPGNRAPATGARALLPSAGTSSDVEQKSECWSAL